MILRAIFFLGVPALIGIDIASTLQAPSRIEAIPVSQLKNDGLSPSYSTQVALVRSDDSALSSPASLTTPLSDAQILAMVYRALDLEGGLKSRLFNGARVVIKPNVVEPANLENGVNTDPRVVEGLIRWIVAHGPDQLSLTVAEAPGGWLAPEMKNTKYNSGGAPVADGFAQAGYRDMRARLAADGIAVTLLDANFGSYNDPLSHLRLEPVPAKIDFPVFPAYWIHETILDADVLINVPVMKIHTPNITGCLKNYIGIAAGAKYGTYKGIGGPDPGDPALHQDWPDYNSVEREIVDLASIAPADYCLVDALVCKEQGKTASHPPVRRNLVLAGADMVAVDTICARLMGLNPDSVPHLNNAAREGLGVMNPALIRVMGERTVDESMYYFERSPEGYQGNRGHFGMNNRIWLLHRAAGTDIDTSFLGVPDAEITAAPGADGWTEPVCFSDDKIDFEAHYGSSDGYIYYAFCWVTVPQEQDAELWITHDESCKVWLGGDLIYDVDAAYQGITLPGHSAKTIHLPTGVHPLLVKLLDQTQSAIFVLNLCRVLPSMLPAGRATYTDLSVAANYKRYEGTRVPGLKFHTRYFPGAERVDDFNNDGKPDIFWRNYATGQNAVWWMDNRAILGYRYPPPAADLNWIFSGTGDFNTDGEPDLVWRNYSTGQNSIWYMDGTKYIGYEMLPAVPDTSWVLSGVEDMNQDGHPDLIWRYYGPGTNQGRNSIWYMNEAADCSGYGYMPAATDLNWMIAGLRDFNGDGYPDLVWRNYSTGRNSLWYMNNAKCAGYGYLPSVPDVNWTIACVNDLDQNGACDIVWRYYGAGTNAGRNPVWYMNNTKCVGYGYLPAVADLHWYIGTSYLPQLVKGFTSLSIPLPVMSFEERMVPAMTPTETATPVYRESPRIEPAATPTVTPTPVFSRGMREG
ncbi:MAG: DUF362 domain-containing protein [bacterium]